MLMAVGKKFVVSRLYLVLLKAAESFKIEIQVVLQNHLLNYNLPLSHYRLRSFHLLQ